MQWLTAVLAGIVVTAAMPARGEIVSAYTELDAETGCAAVSRTAEGEGDWANLVCAGYKGYPVIISYSDGRESIFYGFPPEGAAGFAWESFEGFNSAGETIEWRVELRDGVEIPFAAIHRWKVVDPVDADAVTEVLVVEKVGLLPERQSCAAAYVVASGQVDADGKAREIADLQARDFVCGDQPTVIAGSVPVPAFTRESGGR
jgi:hypothetical protein